MILGDQRSENWENLSVKLMAGEGMGDSRGGVIWNYSA